MRMNSQPLPLESLILKRNKDRKKNPFISKDRYYKFYYRTHFEALQSALNNGSYTMLELAQLTSIERANICRYIAKLRKSDTVTKMGSFVCAISLHKAERYSILNLSKHEK